MATLLVIIVLAFFMRAFVFEIKFGQVREWLEKKNKLANIFMQCSFCNGFWTGLAAYVLFVVAGALPDFSDYTSLLFWLGAVCCAVGSGSLSYYVSYYFFLQDQAS